MIDEPSKRRQQIRAIAKESTFSFLFEEINMRSISIVILLFTLSGCTQTEVRDVSNDFRRVDGFSTDSLYQTQTELFVYGLLFDTPISYYNEADRDLWLLVLTPPLGSENGSVPDSIESWKEDKDRYQGIYGVLPAGSILHVERIEEIKELKDHKTQVLARIQDGEFSGVLVDLSWASEVSADHLKVTIDRNRIRRFEPRQSIRLGPGARVVAAARANHPNYFLNGL